MWNERNAALAAGISCIVVTAFVDRPAAAQSSVELPPVVVATPKTAPRAAARGARTAAPVARRARTATSAAPAASGAGIETATGPVQGYVATQSATATKTGTPIVETPQSISVVTKDQIAAQGVQRVEEALRYVPGVISATNGFDPRGDAFNIRGFQQHASGFYRDGLKMSFVSLGNGEWQFEPYGLERIEVLRGPASILYGQSAPGGIVNLVTKRPLATPFNEVVVTGGNFARKQIAVDSSGPIDKQGEFLYRFTGLVRDADTQVDFVKDKHQYVAPAFTWRPTTDTTFTLLASHQHEETGSAFSFFPASGTVLPNPNGPIPSNRFVGDPNFDGFERNHNSIGYVFEHRFNDAFLVRQNLRYDDLNIDYKNIFSVSGFVSPDQQTVNRRVFQNTETIKPFTLDNQAQFAFQHGIVEHKILLGLDYQRASLDTVLRNGVGPSLNLYNPVYGLPVLTPPVVGSNAQVQEQVGLYVQEQLKVDKKWIFMVGGRQDHATSSTLNRLASTTTNKDDSATSARAGVMYLSDLGVVPYASYSESFLPVAGGDFSGAAFKPETGQQNEIGLKFQPNGYNAMLTLALFDIHRQNVTTADLAHTGFNVQTGEWRSRGVELEGKASLADGLDLIASYTYLDVRVTQSNDATLGKIPTKIPHNTASAWLDYTIGSGAAAGLGFGGGVRYIGPTFGDALNTLVVPSYTLFDAALHYDLGANSPSLRGWRFAVNATNLFDKTYASGCDGLTQCYFGSRRTVLASLRYRWP